MQKLLQAFKDAVDYKAQAKAAQRIWNYNNKHPMAACMLTPEDAQLYNCAINFFN